MRRFLALPAIMVTLSFGYSALAVESAGSTSSTGKIQFNGYLGQPSVTMTNPDGTNAFYSGIALKGQAGFSLFDSHKFGIHLLGTGKYLDLKNSANDYITRETGNHVGAGAGVHVDLFKFFGSVEYEYVLARHYVVGPISNSLEFSYSPMTIAYGLKFDFGQVSLMIRASTTTATIAASAVKLSTAVPYKDSTYWIGLSFRPNVSVGGIIGDLFK